MRTPELNYIGEFHDKETEDIYFSYYTDNSLRLLSVLLIIAPIGYMLMLFLNYHEMGLTFQYAKNIIVRLLLIIPFMIFYFTFKKIADSTVLNKIVLFLCTYLMINYQIVTIINRTTSFSQQAMSFFLLTIAIYMVPIRWIYCFIISLITTLSFFICYTIFFIPEPLYQYARYAVYFSLGLFISGYFSYNLHVHRRLQYIREKHLEILSNTDRLTQIYNRQYFDRMLNQYIHRTKDDQTFSLIMFDLDNFKKLNDNYGHAVGDHILIETSQLINKFIRTNDVFSRWGGEEFIILLPYTEHSNTMQIAIHMCNEIESHFKDTYQMTASFGVTSFVSGDTADTLLRRVDSNLYYAKEHGKNQVIG